ncbi:pyridoxamine 5'-phosphate oxidase family protein [Adlercreutzia aquisgranensis]|uniref:pyridoxamine 5'-phosphate oxidase family protein n=1 Tax=Adlercreutzia aquisgranensis TaxID=2941323 RepID=UPI0020402736|nr:pyridoxamine 5'-phosphate oxidase family protein [Adlercreutzia aquisgranensis]
MSNENGLETILDYLTSVPAWYLATVDGEGQPHVRPFSFAEIQDGRLWFCTSTEKDVYHELQRNPRFEATAWKTGYGWVILRGRADLEDRASESMRRNGFDHMVALGESWESADDARLTFFSVADPQAWICDIDGSWNPVAL